MAKIVPVLFFISFSGVFCSAQADWQNTRWGMSLEQLLTSSNGSFRKASAQEQEDFTIPPLGKALAVGSYQVEDLKFDTTALFDQGKLFGIHLRLKDGSNTEKLFGLTRAIYGKPDKEKDEWKNNCRELLQEWRDVERNNDVTFRARMCIGAKPQMSLVYGRVVGKSEAKL